MTKLFEADDYIRRPGFVTVDSLTGEMAGWLVRHPAFATIRADAMSNPPMYAWLRAVTAVGHEWRSSLGGTPLPNTPEQASELRSRHTSAEAADLLNIQPRAVLQAIKRNKLKASLVGGRWQIERTDIEHYRAARAA